MRWGARIAAALLAGCGGSLPDPVLESISPDLIRQGATPAMRLFIRGVLPFRVDYADSVVQVNTNVGVTIGGIRGPGAYAAEGQVAALIPAALLPGLHDVEVDFSDGRRALLPRALTVEPRVWPTSYVLEPIADQRRNVPFAITIRAQGAGAPEFDASVALEVNRGTITPTGTGAFQAGSRTETVTLSSPGNDVVITVRDLSGSTGASNPFRVVN
jgi:hypothetical protein